MAPCLDRARSMAEEEAREAVRGQFGSARN